MSETTTAHATQAVAHQAANLPQAGAKRAAKKPGQTSAQIHDSILKCLKEAHQPLCDADLYPLIAIKHETNLRWVREAMVRDGHIRPTNKVMLVNGKISSKKYYEITPRGKRLEARLNYVLNHTHEVLDRIAHDQAVLLHHREEAIAIRAEMRNNARRAARRRTVK